MYISITRAAIPAGQAESAQTNVARVHEFMRTMPGFRWAMLLQSVESPAQCAAVSMWLQPEQASAQDATTLGAGEETSGYDVATARGSMTPATQVALVEWEVPPDTADRFTNRWNAAYHAIEERIGSRLLKDLENPGRFAGLHAVTDEANLEPPILAAAITDADGLSITPAAVNLYQVLLLTEP